MAITKPTRLASIYFSGTILLPYDDAIKVMAGVRDAEGLEGWGDSTHKVKATTTMEMKPFDLERYKGIKKAQLLGVTYEEYLEQEDTKNAE